MRKYYYWGGIVLMALNLTSSLAAAPLNLKGDLRLRIQNEKKESGVSRTRKRLRFRLGGSRAISKETQVKFGLATGSADPRSTNQTLQNSFQTPDIRLDYAFVTHQLTDALTLVGGKIKNPLWRPSDLLWDSDINPDGVAITYRPKNTKWGWFVTGGYFELDELSNTKKDPTLLVIQPGVQVKVNGTTQAKVALGVFLSQDIKGLILDHSAGSNSALDEEFSTLVLSGEVAFKKRWGLPLIKPFLELSLNTHKDSAHQGGMLGVKFGDTKVKARGKWQSKISYRYLGQDAWLDIFPDSDAYGGATNVEGLELSFNLGLSPSTSLGIDFYSMDKINGSSDKQSLVQVDLNVKF